jgi:putative transposase
MANSYVCCYVHVVFSTYGRQSLLAAEWRSRVWEYMGGIAYGIPIVPMAIGGTSDHCHVLLGLPATVRLSDAVRRVKGASSKWIGDHIPGADAFAWQDGYGAFSVSPSQVVKVRAYILGQERHHGDCSFESEYRQLLTEAGIVPDERYVFG